MDTTGQEFDTRDYKLTERVNRLEENQKPSQFLRTSQEVAEPMRRPGSVPLMQQISEANNLEEFQNLHEVVSLHSNPSKEWWSLLLAKSLNLARKYRYQADELASQAKWLNEPEELSPEKAKKIQNLINSSPRNELMSLFDETTITTQNSKGILCAAKALLSRLEVAEQREAALTLEAMNGQNQAGQATPLQMNTLKAQVHALEVERHALVQVIRILASGGELDPIQPPSQPDSGV